MPRTRSAHLVGVALLALHGAACNRDEATTAPAPELSGAPSSIPDSKQPAPDGDRCRALGRSAAPTLAMSTFVSGLGSPARSRAALREFAAPGVDVRPMRWTRFDRVEIECSYRADALDCHQVHAIHDTTPSGYARWSRYEVCWRGDRIQRITKLASRGFDGG